MWQTVSVGERSTLGFQEKHKGILKKAATEKATCMNKTTFQFVVNRRSDDYRNYNALHLENELSGQLVH